MPPTELLDQVADSQPCAAIQVAAADGPRPGRSPRRTDRCDMDLPLPSGPCSPSTPASGAPDACGGCARTAHAGASETRLQCVVRSEERRVGKEWRARWARER